MGDEEGKEDKFRRVGPAFQLVANADSPAAVHIPTRPINTIPSSPGSFDLARKWLRTCLETHQACPKPEKFMPTRLVDISSVRGDRLITLRETVSFEDRVEPYAALSYCWGGEQEVKTTTATLPSHLHGFDFEDLPATIKDAIVAAEELNIRLLWIDSLCIIQDDDEDKTAEIASMPLIYSQATVTITASRASSVKEGFLNERPMMGLEAPEAVFQLPFRCSTGTELGSVVLLPPTHEVTEPLDRRGWTMQERFLSRRILEYGTHHTRWACQEYMNSNAPTDGFTNTRVYNQKRGDFLFIRGLKIVMTEADSTEALDSEKADLCYRTWHHLLRLYTARLLSLPADRLRGISGVAALFGKALRDTYWAGLWKSRLATELLWMRKSFTGSEIMPRPTEYQGPSWSWAAINGLFQERFPRKDERPDEDFKVIDCEIQRCGKAAQLLNGQFGAVISAKLVLSGRLQSAVLERRNSSLESMKIHFPSESKGRPEGVISVRETIDCIEQDLATSMVDSVEVFLLTVVVGPDYTSGLVLRRHEEAAYSRLGIFTFDYGCDTPLPWDQGVVQTIALA